MKSDTRRYRGKSLSTIHCPLSIIKLFAITYSLFAIICFPLGAQETLTVDQCRQKAIAHNQSLQAGRAATQAAVYTQRSYRANFLPDFSLSGTGLYSNSDGTLTVEGGMLPTYTPDATGSLLTDGGYAYFPGMNLDYEVGAIYSAGIQLEQPIYMGGKLRAAYSMAKIGRLAAEANEEMTEADVIVRTDQAYAQAVRAKQLQQVATTYVALLDELMRIVESAYDKGLKSKNDVLKVKVKQNEAQLQLRRAENAVRLSRMNLCHVIGLPLTSDIEVSDQLTLPDTDEQTVAFDISSRPEYALLQHQVDIARQQVKLDRSELLPQIGLMGSYSYLYGFEIGDRKLFDKASFAVMLNVSIPLYHFGGRSNKLKASKAKLRETRFQQQDQNEQMMLQLAQAINNMDEARIEQQLAISSLLQAEENMRVSRRQYEVGLETLSDHLEAQTLWQEAYATRIEADFNLFVNHTLLLQAAGLLKSE